MIKEQKQNNSTYEEIPIEDELEKELKKYEKRSYKMLTDQIETEYQLTWNFMKPKFDEWGLRLKLYSNQKRDKKAIGDPLLFTIHQTVLASLYDDKLNVEFLPRERGDEDVADNLTSLADFDYSEMQKNITDYDWNWDAGFFGRGLLDLREFDRKLKIPIPEVLNPMTILRDPRAKSVNGDIKGRNACRFFGREMRLTKNEMRKAGIYFNLDKLKILNNTNSTSLTAENERLRKNAQGYDNLEESLKGENQEFELLEWFTFWRGKRVLIVLANDRKTVVRYLELSDWKIPVIDRTIYPMSHDWDGVSIPDLIEDKQRAKSVIQNLGLKGVKAGLNPMYLFNSDKIKNKSHLNLGYNKFIPINGSVDGTIAEVPRSGIKQEANFILELLDTAAQKSTACYSEDTQTLTENGWKYYWEIEKKDKIATFNPKTKKLEYHTPLKKLVYEYEGEMYHYLTSKGVDLLVTPEHKIFHKTPFDVKNKNSKKDDWKLIPANKIKLHRFEFVVVVADWDGKDEKFIEFQEILYKNQTQYNGKKYKFKMDDWLEFVGYVVSEGYIGKPEVNKGAYRLQLTQKKGKGADKFRNCLNRLKILFKEYENKRDGCIIFLIHNKTIWHWMKKYVKDYSYNKQIPNKIKNASKRQLKILFDAYMFGDGHFPKRKGDENNASTSTASEQLADDLQEIALKLGYKSKITHKEFKNKKHLPIWIINFVFNEDRAKEWGTPRINIKTNLTIEKYKGVVYCFTVPNHLFITRRKGLVSIQGNTPDMQQGGMSKQNRTLGELNLIADKVDTRYSLSARIFGWSEKLFWQQWYKLYKQHFNKDIDDKVLRLNGALGAKWRELTHENIIANTDPDVKIKSKVIATAKRLQELQGYQNYINLALNYPTANKLFALRKLGKLSGLKKNDIVHILPLTIDEIKAEEENETLLKGEIVPVSPIDDHSTHQIIHNKLPDDLPAKYAHIHAHQKGMLKQKENPELFPEQINEQMPEELLTKLSKPQQQINK